VSAGEEYLLDVGRWPGQFIDAIFVPLRPVRSLSSFELVMAMFADGVARIGNLGVDRVLFMFYGAKEWEELDTMLVESQGMAEMDDGIVRAREWQVFWNHSDRLHGVPAEGMRRSIDRWVE
jgi:hypothetical protein